MLCPAQKVKNCPFPLMKGKKEACRKVTTTNKKSTGTISHIDKKFLKFELDITNLQSETRKSQQTKNDTKSASPRQTFK